MDGVTALLERAQAAGLRVSVAGDKLVIQGPRTADTLAHELLAHKPEIVAQLNLPGGAELADTLEDSIALGSRLARGEIAALRCGITGEWCRSCQGVPCFGSTPWMGRTDG